MSRDRVPSAHDPQMRHGRKSKSNRFDGHKAALAVDTDSQLVTAVGILSGNASDNTGALGLVERSEENTGIEVEETIGDAAYGDGATRQAFADAGRTLIAKVPARPEKAHFPKEDFHIDLEAATCTCPAGQKTQSLRVLNHRRNSPSGWKPAWGFVFDGRVCRGCNLRSQCIASKNSKGRSLEEMVDRVMAALFSEERETATQTASEATATPSLARSVHEARRLRQSGTSTGRLRSSAERTRERRRRGRLGGSTPSGRTW